MYKILIVEDDEVIADLVHKNLQMWGYDAKKIENFNLVTEEFAKYNPQLVLMDISLPFFNGYYWCSEIRKISKVPIIFMSSASDGMNIVMAVNMGGDDFVAKPFDLNVLLAKVQAMLRRTYDFVSTLNFIEHKGAILDIGNTKLTFNGLQIELTKNEYKILKILLENKGNAVSRDVIMTVLWESDSYIDDNTLTVNVTRLRKKLDQAGLKNFIETKKGMGYCIED